MSATKISEIQRALVEAGHTSVVGVSELEGVYSLSFDADATQGQIDEANAALAADLAAGHSELAWEKHLRKEEVDARTNEGMAEGCYSYASVEFPHDPETRDLINGLLTRKDLLSYAAPGLRVTRKDGGNHYLQSEQELMDMSALMFGAISYWVDGGGTLKAQIEAATSLAELALIVDERSAS